MSIDGVHKPLLATAYSRARTTLGFQERRGEEAYETMVRIVI